MRPSESAYVRHQERRAGGWRKLPATVLCCAALMTPAVLLPAQDVQISRVGEAWIEQSEHSFSVRRGEALEVDVAGGSVEVQTWNEAAVEVSLRKSTSEITEEQARDRFADAEIAVERTPTGVSVVNRRSYRLLLL